MSKRHTFAKGMVEDAVGRIQDPLRYLTELKAMDEKDLRVQAVMLINQQIVVTGAVLEEVANGHTGWGDKAKAAVIQTVPPFAGMGGLLFVLSLLGII